MSAATSPRSLLTNLVSETHLKGFAMLTDDAQTINQIW